MSSCITLSRQKLANRLDCSAAPSIVSYKYCVKRNLSYCLLSLDYRCTNCIYSSYHKCELEEVTLLDFSKINIEMSHLEKEEEDIEVKLYIEEMITKEALAYTRRLRERIEKVRYS